MVSKSGNPECCSNQWGELPSPGLKRLRCRMNEHHLGGHFHEQHHGQMQTRPRDIKPDVRIDIPNDEKANRQDKQGNQSRSRPLSVSYEIKGLQKNFIMIWISLEFGLWNLVPGGCCSHINKQQLPPKRTLLQFAFWFYFLFLWAFMFFAKYS